MRMRSPDEHVALVAELQAELLADDVEPPSEADEWPEAALRAWLEDGGPDFTQGLCGGHETDCELPRPKFHLCVPGMGSARVPEGPPLNARLLTFPERPPLGLVWVCPMPRFGVEQQLQTMDSPLVQAIRDACVEARVPLLRFDHHGVLGSGGSSALTTLEGTRRLLPGEEE
eukprot:5511802-Prymnesium_polylepis.1